MDTSDTLLLQFLDSCPAATIVQFAAFMDSWLSPDSWKFKVYTNDASVPASGSGQRAELSRQLAYQLRYFGSNSFAYLARKAMWQSDPGVSYKETVRDVCTVLADQLAKARDDRSWWEKLPGVGWLAKAREPPAPPVVVPEAAVLEEYEDLVVDTLLKISLAGKTPEQVAEMFEACGIPKEQAKEVAIKFSKDATLHGLISAVPFAVGKALMKDIVLNIIFEILVRIVGRETAKKIIERLAGQLPQKYFAYLTIALGVGLTLWDVANLAGPASRVTLPCVGLVSASRAVDRRTSKEAGRPD